MVFDGDLVRSKLLVPGPGAESITGPLLEALALEPEPHPDLKALYHGCMNCLTATDAARLTRNLGLPSDPAAAAAQRESLPDCQRLEQEAVRVRTQAAEKRQIAKQSDLNLATQRLQADLQEVRARPWCLIPKKPELSKESPSDAEDRGD